LLSQLSHECSAQPAHQKGQLMAKLRTKPVPTKRETPKHKHRGSRESEASGIRITEQDAPKVIRALEHYAAYMRATNRDDRDYRELALALQPDPFGCASNIDGLPAKRN
jgi:hypothetical protein